MTPMTSFLDLRSSFRATEDIGQCLQDKEMSLLNAKMFKPCLADYLLVFPFAFSTNIQLWFLHLNLNPFENFKQKLIGSVDQKFVPARTKKGRFFFTWLGTKEDMSNLQVNVHNAMPSVMMCPWLHWFCSKLVKTQTAALDRSSAPKLI